MTYIDATMRQLDKYLLKAMGQPRYNNNHVPPLERLVDHLLERYRAWAGNRGVSAVMATELLRMSLKLNALTSDEMKKAVRRLPYMDKPAFLLEDYWRE